MKNGIKLLTAGAALLGTALGVAAYRRYRDSYEQLLEGTDINENDLNEESDFEPIVEVDDGFTYYVEDPEQIMFHE